MTSYPPSPQQTLDNAATSNPVLFIFSSHNIIAIHALLPITTTAFCSTLINTFIIVPDWAWFFKVRALESSKGLPLNLRPSAPQKGPEEAVFWVNPVQVEDEGTVWASFSWCKVRVVGFYKSRWPRSPCFLLSYGPFAPSSEYASLSVLQIVRFSKFSSCLF